MSKEKRKYNVYLRQVVFDSTGDPDKAIHYEDFMSSTWAVSPEKAACNVRFRNGDKYDYMVFDFGEAYYWAVDAEYDTPDQHKGFVSFVKTH